MNKKIGKITFLILLLLPFGVVLAAADPVGEVANLEGRADVTRADETVEELAIGVPLYREDIVRTKSDALLEITLNDGSALTLDEGTRLVLADYVLDVEPQGSFDLLRGRVRAVVTDTFARRSNSFKVKTPTALIGVQGTDFFVDARALSTLTYVLSGLVNVSSIDPNFPGTQLLRANQFVVVRKDAPVPPPTTDVSAQADGGMGSGGELDRRSGGTQANDPTLLMPFAQGFGALTGDNLAPPPPVVPPLPNPPPP